MSDDPPTMEHTPNGTLEEPWEDFWEYAERVVLTNLEYTWAELDSREAPRPDPLDLSTEHSHLERRTLPALGFSGDQLYGMPLPTLTDQEEAILSDIRAIINRPSPKRIETWPEEAPKPVDVWATFLGDVL